MATPKRISGNINNVILKLLYESDNYANEIIRQINSLGPAEVKQADVYATLKYLEKNKLTSSYWDESDGKRKYYTLTKLGKNAYMQYKNELERSKDLFGDLVTGDATLLPADDFTDVEDDEYKIPKRPAVRSRKKEKKQNVVVEYTPPEFSGEFTHQVNETQEKSDENLAKNSENITEAGDEKNQAEPKQRSMFDDAIVLDENEGKSDERQAQEGGQAEKSQNQTEVMQPTASDVIDPHQRLEQIYSNAYVENKSYADAPRQAPEKTDEVKQKSELPELRKEPLPAPKQESAPAEAAPRRQFIQPQESVAKQEYKSILNDLVDSCEAQVKAKKSEPAPQEEMQDEVKSTEFGDSITVRVHNDSAKQYNHKYYYYSNRLLMTRYTIMCALMFVIGLTLFFTFFFGLNLRMKYDYLLYIFIGLLPILMFIAAVIIYAAEPDKKKRINVNFRFSIMIRIVVMIQIIVVVYCINLIWGMPVSFSINYLPSLVIPCAYALFVPMSELIFMNLLNSERYAVE